MVPGGYSTQASKESSDSKAQIVGSDSSSGGSGEGDDMKWYQMGRGIMQDLRNRIPYYLDDYKVCSLDHISPELYKSTNFVFANGQLFSWH